MADLSALIDETHPDVLALQETWYWKRARCPGIFKNYTAFRQDRCDSSNNHLSRGGGVAIYVARHLQASLYRPTLSAPLEAVGCAVRFNNATFHILSVYDPWGSASLNTLSALTATLDGPFLVLGDFNGTHSSWGSRPTDTQGRVIRSWIDHSTNLVLLNTGAPTRYSASGTPTFMDLSIASPALSASVQWTPRVFGTSDHLPIFLEVAGQAGVPTPDPTSARIWLYKRANWAAFRASLIRHAAGPSGHFDSWTNLHTTILAAAAEHIPHFDPETAGPRRCRPVWWDKELHRRQTDLNRHRRSLVARPSLTSLIEYKRKRAIFRKLVRTAKRHSWHSYCSALSGTATTTEVWQKVRWFTTGAPRSLAVPAFAVNGVPVTSAAAAAAVLNDAYSAKYYVRSGVADTGPADAGRDGPCPATDAPITRSEYDQAVRGLKPTCPGGDHVSK